MTRQPRQPLPSLAELRLRTAAELLGVLETELATLRAARDVKTCERTRAVCQVVLAALKCLELGDMSERLAVLEAAVAGEVAEVLQ